MPHRDRVCGRFNLEHQKLPEPFSELRLPARLGGSFNITPSESVLSVREPKLGAPEAALLRWGLIPRWAKDAKIGYKLINARAESLLEKPAFKHNALYRRCLIWADSFFEWSGSGKQRRPHCIKLKSGEVFAMAGVWDAWQSPEGKTIETCTVITVPANALIAPLHDRMPAIIAPKHYAAWVNPELHDGTLARQALVPYGGRDLIEYAVSKWVNDPLHKDAKCIEPEA